MKEAVVFLTLIINVVHLNGHSLQNSHSHCEFDLLILVDSSGSIMDDGGEKNWGQVMNFTKTLITDIDENTRVGSKTRVGVFSYSSRVLKDIPIDANKTKDEIIQFIDNKGMHYQGSVTRMYLAVKAAAEHLRATRRPTETGLIATQILILFTDGVPFSFESSDGENPGNVMRVLQELMNEEVYVSMIGINKADGGLMASIADYKNSYGNQDFGRAEKAADFAELGSRAFSRLVIDPLKLSCEAKSPSCKLDIFILIDSSGSIGNSIFMNEVKPFAEMLIDSIDDVIPIRGDGTRVGVMSFSRTSVKHLDIDDGTSPLIVKQAIDSMTHAGSWTHMVEYLEDARDMLLDHKREGVGLRLILITDGVPEHSENDDKETVENLKKTIYDMRYNSAEPIITSIVGFEGEKKSLELSDVLDDLGNYSETWNVKDQGLSKGVANSVVDGFGIECKVEPLLDICPTDVVIVLDDTSDETFQESRLKAKDIMIGQLMHYVEDNRMTLTIVSSSQIVDAMQFDTLRRNVWGDNLLLRALNKAHDAFLAAPSFGYGRYKLLILIHSGVMNYDGDEIDDKMNSFKNIVFKQLKYDIGADIWSLPLSMTDGHGMEILARLHTGAGHHLLEPDVNVPYMIFENCPQFDPCEAIDIAMLLDIGRSSDLDMVKRQALATLTFLRNNYASQTRVALITFSEFPCVHSDLERGQILDEDTFNELKNITMNLTPSMMPRTNLAYALNLVSHMIFDNHGDRPQGTNHIIIFSDGEVNMQTVGRMGTSEAIEMALQIPSSILMVNPPVKVDSPYTDLSTHNLPMIRDIESINAELNKQLNHTRDCRAMDPVTCKGLVILIDSSGSLEDHGRKGFSAVQTYVIKVIQGYYARHSGPLAVVQFSFNAEILVQPANYKNNVNDAVENIVNARHLRGETNVEKGIKVATDIVGEDKDKYVILFLTDGESNKGRSGAEELEDKINEGYNFRVVFVTQAFEDKVNNMQKAVDDPANKIYVPNFPQLKTNATFINFALDNLCTV